MRLLIFTMLVACGAAQGGSAPERGDAARILCEAECGREQRCGHGDPSCLPGCAQLPVRRPAVWSSGWAHEVGACIDRSSCAHDADESCVLATSRHTRASDACLAQPSSERWMCPVLNGLTDDAADRVRACYQRGEERCIPSFDWK